MHHSKRAFKKTVVFVIFLGILMIVSFLISEYEYNKVNQEYQKAFDSGNQTIISPVNASMTNTTTKMTSRNETKPESSTSNVTSLAFSLNTTNFDINKLLNYSQENLNTIINNVNY